MTNSEAELKLQELLADRPDDVVDIALAARSAVRKAAGSCSELVYATYAISSVHTFTGKLGQAFIHIATYTNHVNLGFNRGVELSDPDDLLTGTGKLIRHVRLNAVSDLQKKPIKDLIKAAAQQGRELAESKQTPASPVIRLV
ncbi:MAG: DUF1801 domain-containing protein [Planctomycetaceae bacterium]